MYANNNYRLVPNANLSVAQQIKFVKYRFVEMLILNNCITFFYFLRTSKNSFEVLLELCTSANDSMKPFIRYKVHRTY